MIFGGPSSQKRESQQEKQEEVVEPKQTVVYEQPVVAPKVVERPKYSAQISQSVSVVKKPHCEHARMLSWTSRMTRAISSGRASRDCNIHSAMRSALRGPMPGSRLSSPMSA